MPVVVTVEESVTWPERKQHWTKDNKKDNLTFRFGSSHYRNGDLLFYLSVSVISYYYIRVSVISACSQ